MYVILFQHSQIIYFVLCLFIVTEPTIVDEGFDFWMIGLIVGGLLIIIVIPIICWAIFFRKMV